MKSVYKHTRTILANILERAFKISTNISFFMEIFILHGQQEYFLDFSAVNVPVNLYKQKIYQKLYLIFILHIGEIE